MKTTRRLLSHLAQLFLESEIFPTKLYRKSKHTFCFQ